MHFIEIVPLPSVCCIHLLNVKYKNSLDYSTAVILHNIWT